MLQTEIKENTNVIYFYSFAAVYRGIKVGCDINFIKILYIKYTYYYTPSRITATSIMNITYQSLLLVLSLYKQAQKACGDLLEVFHILPPPLSDPFRLL